MVLLAGAMCGVRNDSCSRTHQYARTLHGMASESAGTAGRDAAGSIAGAGAVSSSSGRAGPAGVICASGGARWGGAASAVVSAHWREPLVMQVQDLAEVRRHRFRGHGGGESEVIGCQAGEGCVHSVQPRAAFPSRSAWRVSN